MGNFHYVFILGVYTFGMCFQTNILKKEAEIREKESMQMFRQKNEKFSDDSLH